MGTPATRSPSLPRLSSISGPKAAGWFAPALAASHAEERISVWMGHRPSLPDSLPVLGPSPASPDVIYAFGHGHVGMTAAPMTGKIVADLVAGRPAPIDIAPFAPGRFGGILPL